MSRLIDADALKATITVDGYEHFSGCLSSSEVSLLEMVMDDIDESQTVDAVPVVRCENCEHGNPCGDDVICHHPELLREMAECTPIHEKGFFCAYGEPKEGVNNEP